MRREEKVTGQDTFLTDMTAFRFKISEKVTAMFHTFTLVLSESCCSGPKMVDVAFCKNEKERDS